MTERLITRFIQDSSNTADPRVRRQYSDLAGKTGIFVNLLLALIKFLVGLFSHSLAVVSDAVNNLSDAAASLVSLFAVRISARSADQKHPFGHGRMEYLAALVVAGLIFSAAFELLSGSIRRILEPGPVESSWGMIVLLFLTVFIKLWMSRFYETIGTRIHHAAILASAKDARSDVIATGLTIASMILSLLKVPFPIDGIAGVLLSLYLFTSGCGIAREIISKLLGEEESGEVREQIEAIIREEKGILGMHDLITHDYGPEHRLGSVHCELPAEISLLEAHGIIDRCERGVREKLGVDLTIHPDPVRDDALTRLWKRKTQEALKAGSPGYAMHDFRVSQEKERILVSFDLSCPFESRKSDEEILRNLASALKSEEGQVFLKVTFDHGYLSHTEEIHEPAEK